MTDLKIKPYNNYVLIKPDTDMSKSNVRGFSMDTSFDEAGHAPRTGVVIALPDELDYDRENTQGLQWETSMDLEVGDQVTYHYLSALTAEDKATPRFFIYNDEKYYFIKYDRIYTAKRLQKEAADTLQAFSLINAPMGISHYEELMSQTEVVCLNGFILVEPVQDATLKKYEGYLSIPLRADKFYGIVKYIGSVITDYGAQYDGRNVPDSDDIEVGDTIVMDQTCDIPLEYPLHAKLDDNKVLYRVQRRYIIGKL
jgi:hypothetical protein